jgi:hypothetical protein
MAIVFLLLCQSTEFRHQLEERSAALHKLVIFSLFNEYTVLDRAVISGTPPRNLLDIVNLRQEMEGMRN